MPTSAPTMAPMGGDVLSMSSVTARLSLANKKLEAVPEEVEALAMTLSALDLSLNALATPLGLPNLPLLVELRLRDNALDAVAVQRSSPLPAGLRLLDLGANRLAVFPPCILRLRSLTVLMVDRQRLRSLPPQLSLLTELVELDAGFNELATALQLDSPGLPRLQRLSLRSNAIGRAGALSLDPDALPRLTELDLAGNGFVVWPNAVSRLTSLRSLCLSNNGLTSLVSAESVPHRRMWVPAAGVHSLPQLSELLLAQNALAELPASLTELRALVRLDVRCNPLSDASLALAAAHCEALSTRLDCTSIRRAAVGLLLGDESSAWHRPTVLRAHVSRLLSVGRVPPNGIPVARLAAKLPDEVRLLGLVPAPPSDGRAALVSVEGLRRAFRAAALRFHPDKVAPEERDAAAAHFARLQDAYRAVGRAVATERRRLPEFDELVYGFVDLPEAAAAAGGDEAAEGAALAAAFRAQLPAALAFAAEARHAADGELLIHSAGRSPAPAIAVVLAILIDTVEPYLDHAVRRLCETLGRETPDLPACLLDELEAFAARRRAEQLQIVHDDGRPAGQLGELDGEIDGGAGRYLSRLTMADPFAPRDEDGDEHGHPFAAADPFAAATAAALDEIHRRASSPLADDDEALATGGVCAAEAAEAAPARRTTHSIGVGDETEDTDPMGGLGSGHEPSDLPAPPPQSLRGWRVDEHGRNVLELGGGWAGRGRFNFSSVVVEHEPGAQVGPPAGSASPSQAPSQEADRQAEATLTSTAC